jgi:L-aminopeptidase/D-esterase-like protein
MQGLKVGHFTSSEKGTGVSVFLFDCPAQGAYVICGSAPASHELAALDPDNSVPHIHGLMLSGGSAYGLYAAQGVMRYLTEQGLGHPVPHGVVPIVPAAAIYDLYYKQPEPPTAEEAYQACLSASTTNTDQGAIGGGTGATVGKLIPQAHCMKGGLGRAQVTLPDGVEVIAYAITNCVGDIRDETGTLIAGAQYADGQFAHTEAYFLAGNGAADLFAAANTTLVAVFTNAQFSKAALKRIAKMAVAGFGRAIAPVFTHYDGDMVFCVSLGEKSAAELAIGTVAAEVVRRAIVNAVIPRP